MAFPQSDTIFLRPSTVHGQGLFAQRALEPGEVLFDLTGTIVWAPFIDGKSDEGPNWYAIGWELWVSPPAASPALYLNHSCTPNIALHDDLGFRPLRPIENGEELTLDYSSVELDPFWQMTCACGTSACRQTVRPFYQYDDATAQAITAYTPQFLQSALGQGNQDRMQTFLKTHA
ncbi:MAG: SET domain-containing protein [Rhodothermaceae bacterium]|nr:SET domain-containing protein [Rhodothermaceae bacterium]